ncbi:hypothetical protein I7I50_11255 [Histoplasma capsulatum G186AR]|uniref:Uncharacterized protein n=1 Tax=Ajellomyces capsulatus TaxID=5037 RepID=A0A8H8D794_AJECA|nr:hypothetical protein I7I52_02493 [Histoplasma capsulatum]QSS69829.1 hypothetical protein I7I50_11255 [Histoplasma capsulatum G186AR]
MLSQPKVLPNLIFSSAYIGKSVVKPQRSNLGWWHDLAHKKRGEDDWQGYPGGVFLKLAGNL